MAKKIKIKLPKRIAGVKIPKVMRKGMIADFLNSGRGQTMMAEALVAAAAMFTASKSESAREAGKTVAETGTARAERLAHACKAAAKAFHEALQDETEETWKETPEAGKGKTRKKSSARASSTTTH